MRIKHTTMRNRLRPGVKAKPTQRIDHHTANLTAAGEALLQLPYPARIDHYTRHGMWCLSNTQRTTATFVMYNFDMDIVLSHLLAAAATVSFEPRRVALHNITVCTVKWPSEVASADTDTDGE